ncbi:MAG: RNA polymerase sigma factor [Isosphaeraceae bacterium]
MDPKSDEASGSPRFTPEAHLSFLEDQARRHRRDLDPLLSKSELVQRTVTAAWERREQFRGTSVPEYEAWLRKIMRNQVRKHRRAMNAGRRQEWRKRSLDAIDGDGTRSDLPEAWLALVESSVGRRVARELDRETAMRLVEAAMGRLDAIEREVLTLCFLKGWTQEAVGHHLAISRDAVARRIRQALKKVRAELSPMGESCSGTTPTSRPEVD